MHEENYLETPQQQFVNLRVNVTKLSDELRDWLAALVITQQVEIQETETQLTAVIEV